MPLGDGPGARLEPHGRRGATTPLTSLTPQSGTFMDIDSDCRSASSGSAQDYSH
jgi:hypothetical protein